MFMQIHSESVQLSKLTYQFQVIFELTGSNKWPSVRKCSDQIHDEGANTLRGSGSRATCEHLLLRPPVAWPSNLESQASEEDKKGL